MLQFLCIPGNPSGGTPYQSILKVEFRHELGVSICLILLLLSGTCLATEGGLLGSVCIAVTAAHRGAAQLDDFLNRSPSCN